MGAGAGEHRCCASPHAGRLVFTLLLLRAFLRPGALLPLLGAGSAVRPSQASQNLLGFRTQALAASVAVNAADLQLYATLTARPLPHSTTYFLFGQWPLPPICPCYEA